MTPSQVRERILTEHEALRRQLNELEAMLVNVTSEPGQLVTTPPSLTRAASALLTALLAHTQLEDEILASTLLELDAWGPVRARSLQEHHVAQRNQLSTLLQSYASSPSYEHTVQMTLEWLREIRADMHHEERDLLSASLLRDDPVAVGMECG